MSKKEININNFNDDAIQVLEGLDAVRKRRGCILDHWQCWSPSPSLKLWIMQSMKPYLDLVIASM